MQHPQSALGALERNRRLFGLDSEEDHKDQGEEKAE